MREIKFRGRHAVTNKWVYGSLLAPDIIGFVSLVNTNDGRGVHPEIQEFCVVVPESVGQYTGLKDKNGVDVYEGDIFDLPEYVGYVDYAGGEYRVILDDQRSVSLAPLHCKNLAVVGNVYENPELLGEVA